jgi:hypothetical protein
MPSLEAQLTAATQEFVARVVDIIRNASFADVASFSAASTARAPASTASSRGARGAQPSQSSPRRGRQTAAGRAQIGERLLETLRDASEPMGVRALSDQLGVVPEVLAVPLRELRTAGKIRKHGEKRATTYSAA